MSKIMLAVSERWAPDTRMDAIADFALRINASLLAVHVVYGTEGGGTEVSPGERTLEQIALQLRGKQLKVDTLLLFSDDTADAIVKTAAEQGATIILLGLSSKGMLARLIEGNVAQEVIKQTKTPVLLIPPDWKGTI